MKVSLVIAALVAAGGSAAGAGALNLLGSDSLFNVTTAAISGCSGATGLVYEGTGTSNGENAMVAGTQNINPSTKFISSNVCTATGGLTELEATNAIVIGLDGLSLLGSVGSGGPSACNGVDTTDCNPEAVGAGYNTTVAGYTFTTWKDVLAVLYGGKSHETTAQINANSGANSGCSGSLRASIANTWGNLFQTGSSCASASGDGCTELQHAFRRDDSTGQADLFATLIGLSPSVNAESNYGFGTTPYCNANVAGIATATAATPIQITTTIAHHLTTGQSVQIAGVGVDVNDNTIASGNIAANGTWVVTVVDQLNFTLNSSAGTSGQTKVGSYAMVLLPPPTGLLADFIPTSYRDLDPVRRPCANNGSPTLNLEDVCGRDNQLGLVLPVVTTKNLTAGVPAQFPSAACAGGTNQAVKTAILSDPTQPSGAGNAVNVNANCPNGDTPHGGNLCPVPAAGGTNTACFAGPSDKPFVFNTKTGLSPSPGQVLGTVYNSRLMTSTKTFQNDVFANPITGAWYRIHQVDAIAGSGASIAAGANINGGTGNAPVVPATGTGVCQQNDPANQMGCLVNASPCSVGFEGRGALAWNGSSSANNVAIKINEVLPLAQCIQSFDYALSRKLYLATLPGFAASTAAEDGLAQCESSESFIGPILTANNFINFATTGPFAAPNAGTPFAEDFNETLVCPTQAPAATKANVNAITANVSPIPSIGTICGNAFKENFEDCDDGTPAATGSPNTYVPLHGGNGSSTSNCSILCRWVGNPPAIDAGTDSVTSTPCGGTGSVAGDACTSTTNGAGKCYLVGLAQVWTCLP
jgi:hypothetical protein